MAARITVCIIHAAIRSSCLPFPSLPEQSSPVLARPIHSCRARPQSPCRHRARIHPAQPCLPRLAVSTLAAPYQPLPRLACLVATYTASFERMLIICASIASNSFDISKNPLMARARFIAPSMRDISSSMTARDISRDCFTSVKGM